jgi:hypothetical protein
VQVVNFVAKGTIEEGMLSVLQFKKSLFSGVLDGGEKEVFLGGSRLSKFIETVEKATDSIPQPSYDDVSQPDSEEPAARNGSRRREPAEPPPIEAGAADPWAGLIQTGLSFLQGLQSAAQPGNRGGSSMVGTDEKTGVSYLKLPMPKPEMMPQVMQALGTLLQAFSK